MYQISRVGEARDSDIHPEVCYHKVIRSINVNAETDLRRVKVKVKFTKAQTGRTNTTLLFL